MTIRTAPLKNRLSRHRSACGALLLVLAEGLCGQAAWAAFTASTDRTQLAAGESVQLTLQSDRSGSSQPQLAPLDKDFEVLSRSTSSSLQFVNGSLSSWRQVQLVLAPRRSGRLEVPPLQWDGDTSSAIELAVAANGTGANGGSPGTPAGTVAHVFLTTSLDSLQPHVQSAVSLKVQLYSDQKLYQASLDLPSNADVRVQRIGNDTNRQETRNGRTYQVIERHYLLVPQRSGDLQLDGPVLNAQVADVNGRFDPFIERLFGQLQIEGGLSGTRPLKLRGDALKLAVQPRPPAWRTSDWLPAQQLTLHDSWRPADKVIAVGEPLTRRLHLAAVGQSASQLPDLSTAITTPDGLHAHAEEAQLSDELHDGHVVGQRAQDLTLLADRPGRYQLPELRVPWWDVVSNQRREAVLPALTIEVVAASNSGAGGAPADPPPAGVGGVAGVGAAAASALPVASAAAAGRATLPWREISAAFALLWLATLGGWFWTHRRHRRSAGPPAPAATQGPQPTDRAAHQAFLQACRDHAARPAREALMAWARATWPRDTPMGLNALARRLGDPALTALLRELDCACLAYTPWNGEALARALPQLSAPATSRTPTATAQALPDLYCDRPAPR